MTVRTEPGTANGTGSRKGKNSTEPGLTHRQLAMAIGEDCTQSGILAPELPAAAQALGISTDYLLSTDNHDLPEEEAQAPPKPARKRRTLTESLGDNGVISASRRRGRVAITVNPPNGSPLTVTYATAQKREGTIITLTFPS